MLAGNPQLPPVPLQERSIVTRNPTHRRGEQPPFRWLIPRASAGAGPPRVGRHRHRRALPFSLGATLLLLLQAAPAQADIWGYVDADRMPHFAESRLDERYELLLSDTVEPYKRTGPTAMAQASPLDTVEPGLAQPPGGLVRTVVPLSPKLQVFYDQSKTYKTVSPILWEASRTHGIDYSLLKALITAESGFNAGAVSPKGAVGLMQLIPPTAERYGVRAGKGATVEKKLTDPKTNIRAGARYLADLIKMFPGRLELALAAYNAGEGAVQRAGNKIPNYPETQNYVKTVMQLYGGLASASSQSLAGRASGDGKTGSATRYSAQPLREPHLQTTSVIR
ncbi:MAG: lytic transglycosylase [Polaromonas sp.]|nr:lytic transglycosylase [Polaromonas sp.]